ncbi:MAG: undecaprenyl-diphosphate phosphatase [Eubacterium sp.]|nr:undecaprenyl-diphosphate phosphatase [Eubacterium sp.]
MLNILKVVLLGIIEGITEWLPISSTGHLILFGKVLNPSFSPEFTAVFNVVIQLGAIIAVIVLFIGMIWPFHTPAKAAEESWFKKEASSPILRSLQNFADRFVYMDRIILWLKIIVSSIPPLILGMLCEDWFEEHLHKPVPVAVLLIIWGFIFLIVESKKRKARVKTTKKITFLQAFIIGIFEALAIMPGTSRSGSTIIGGLLLGLSRPCAAQYTFFLAIPAMAGASVIKLAGYEAAFTGIEIASLIIGMIVAFLVSLLVIRKLMAFIRKHTFKGFGWYRIVLGIIVIVCAAAKLI